MSEPPVRPIPGWRLPSGQLLVEYALRAGLASSPLLVRLPLIGANWAGQALGAADGRVDGRPSSLATLAEQVSTSAQVSRKRRAGVSGGRGVSREEVKL